MSGINLLPWRAELRKRKQKEFLIYVCLSLLGTVLLMAAVHHLIERRIDFQNQRNEFLKSEMVLLDDKIKEIKELETKKEKLIAKMDVIERLQISRPEIVHLLDDLARINPEGIQLTELTQNDVMFTIAGIAQSNARVSAYMRALDLSSSFEDPLLTVIESKPDNREKSDSRGSKFSLQVKQSNNEQNQLSELKGGSIK